MRHPRGALALHGRSFALSLVLLACNDSDTLDGRVYLSPLVTNESVAVGLAVDFIPISGTFAAEKVALAIDVQGDSLSINGESVSSACVRMPSLRLNLLASDGILNPTSRVRVQALRLSPTANASNGGQANLGGLAGTPNSRADCSGALLDDAVWPTRGARTVEIPTGGANGVGGLAGNGGVTAQAGGDTSIAGTSSQGGSAASSAGSSTVSTAGTTTQGGASTPGGSAGVGAESTGGSITDAGASEVQQ